MGGSNRFSHGHFSSGRNVKGNGPREWRSLERKNKAKSQRQSDWRLKAEQKLQRDMRSVQRQFEDINLEVHDIKVKGDHYDENVWCCECCIEILEADERGEWYDAYGNEFVPEDIWEAEQKEVLYEVEQARAELAEEDINEEWSAQATPDTTWSGSSQVLYTPPGTPPTRTPSQATGLNISNPVSPPVAYSAGYKDWILFDGGTGSEIDFDNMSDIDPRALDGMF